MTDSQDTRLALVLNALDDIKAKQVTHLDVRDRTNVADIMVIANGTSSRHLKAIAEDVVAKVKASGELPLGVEGQAAGEWVLVDLGDILVHIMLPESRQHYDLERLWQTPPTRQPDDE